MKSIEKYYDVTEADVPRTFVKYFIEKIKCNQTNAIDLGCGAGNDTVYLIKNGWNVLAIDRENVESRITKIAYIKQKEVCQNPLLLHIILCGNCFPASFLGIFTKQTPPFQF